MFSVAFDKQVEDDRIIDEIEVQISFKNNQILKHSDIDNIDLRLQVEKKSKAKKNSGWRLI